MRTTCVVDCVGKPGSITECRKRCENLCVCVCVRVCACKCLLTCAWVFVLLYMRVLIYVWWVGGCKGGALASCTLSSIVDQKE